MPCWLASLRWLQRETDIGYLLWPVPAGLRGRLSIVRGPTAPPPPPRTHIHTRRWHDRRRERAAKERTQTEARSRGEAVHEGRSPATASAGRPGGHLFTLV